MSSLKIFLIQVRLKVLVQLSMLRLLISSYLSMRWLFFQCCSLVCTFTPKINTSFTMHISLPRYWVLWLLCPLLYMWFIFWLLWLTPISAVSLSLFRFWPLVQVPVGNSDSSRNSWFVGGCAGLSDLRFIWSPLSADHQLFHNFQ